MAKGSPLYPLEYPSHALLLLGFGLVFWSIAKAISFAAKNKETLIEYSRHNPFFIRSKGRPMTKDEADKRLPPLFWTVYGAGGRFAQWIGLAIMTFGFFALSVAIYKKYFI